MKKILIIEDDTVMRENTAEILELANYEVVTAPNGKKGSMIAKEIKPDLIVCDIMMPELDGYGVFHVLSKDPTTASIPFIFLTAKAEKSEYRKGMDLGADDYLTKPFEDTELLNAIEARLKKNDVLKKEFSRNIQGLNQFLDTASGIKQLETLSKNRSPSLYKKKEIIFHSGDTPHYLYFLNKGRIKTYRTHADGKEFITGVFKEGDFFGHVSLFDQKAYTESALVQEESEIYKIPKADFLSLTYQNSEIASQFIKMLSNQIDEQEKQLVRMAYDTVRKRTAEALLQLLKNFPNKGKEDSISFTREDIASMAGTATETVIRCLTDFKEDKFIEVKGREIFILNQKALEKIQ